MNLDAVLIDKYISAAPGYISNILPLCELSFTICQNKKTLKIQCPNSFATTRINHAMFGEMGQKMNALGINRYLIDNGSDFIALHKFMRGNFFMVALSDNSSNGSGDLNLISL